MSLLRDLGLTECDWENVSQPLRERIVEKYARLKGLDLVTGIQSFRRDSKRLDDTTRAVRKQQGLDMREASADEIVLGDKHIHTNVNERRPLLTIAAWAASALAAAAIGYGISQMNTPDPLPQPPSQPAGPADNITRVVPGFGTPQAVEQ